MKIFKIASEQNWYKAPEMMGHILSIKAIKLAEEAMLPYYDEFKPYIDYIFNTSAIDWQDYNFAKTYINLAKKFIKTCLVKQKYMRCITNHLYKNRIDHANDMHNAIYKEDLFESDSVLSIATRNMSMDSDTVKQARERIEKLKVEGRKLGL